MTTKNKNTSKKQPVDSQEDIDTHIVVICDLIIDSFIEKRQRTKGTETRHTKEELKPIFRDSDSRLSKSERA